MTRSWSSSPSGFHSCETSLGEIDENESLRSICFFHVSTLCPLVTFTTSKTKNKFRGKERNRERKREKRQKETYSETLVSSLSLSLWIIGTPTTNFQSHEVKNLKRTSRWDETVSSYLFLGCSTLCVPTPPFPFLPWNIFIHCMVIIDFFLKGFSREEFTKMKEYNSFLNFFFLLRIKYYKKDITFILLFKYSFANK